MIRISPPTFHPKCFLLVLVFECCKTKSHDLSGLQKHTSFTISQFSRVRSLGTGELDLCLGSQKTAFKLLGLLAEPFFSSGPGPSFLAGCQLGAAVCSYCLPQFFVITWPSLWAPSQPGSLLLE
jgi:hypothetical protein